MVKPFAKVEWIMFDIETGDLFTGLIDRAWAWFVWRHNGDVTALNKCKNPSVSLGNIRQVLATDRAACRWGMSKDVKKDSEGIKP